MRLNAYTLPLIISLLLHALVLGLVFQKWESTHKPRKVEIPQHVQAQIVDFNPRGGRGSAGRGAANYRLAPASGRTGATRGRATPTTGSRAATPGAGACASAGS